MIRALFSAASGMVAQQMSIDNIAHNLANSNTTGFKRRRVEFQDLLYQNILAPGTQAGQQTVVPSGLQLGLGTRVVSNEVIFKQGDFISTGNPLDVVIEGSGFFQVRMPSGELAYSRAGSFHLDRDGNLVTSSGDPLEPNITIPREAMDITIASDGTVSYTQVGQIEAQQAGIIQLAGFQNPAGCWHSGGICFNRPKPPETPCWACRVARKEGLGRLQQGFLESSNVSVVEEFIAMILSQRAYEANARVVRTADEMYQEANSLSR